MLSFPLPASASSVPGSVLPKSERQAPFPVLLNAPRHWHSENPAAPAESVPPRSELHAVPSGVHTPAPSHESLFHRIPPALCTPFVSAAPPHSPSLSGTALPDCTDHKPAGSGLLPSGSPAGDPGWFSARPYFRLLPTSDAGLPQTASKENCSESH